MDDSVADETQQLPAVRRKLKLRRETVQNLTEDLLSSQGHSLWTCDRPAKPGEPETTYMEIDAVRVEVHIDVHQKS